MKIRVTPVEVGELLPMPVDVAPTRELKNEERPVGRPVVLNFFVGPNFAGATEVLGKFAELYEEFAKAGATVFGTAVATLDKLKAFADERKLPFALLADVQLKLSLTYGAAKPHHVENNKAEVSVGPRTVLLDANHRVVKIYEPIDPAAHPAEVLEDVKRLVNADAPRAIVRQAPVLLIPDALPADFCSQLIEVWEKEGNEDSGFMKQVDGKTVGLYDYGHKIRRDHFVKEGPTLTKIKNYVANRVLPEIRKAFNYEVTRFEDFRIACYDASRGGYFRPHRDNTTDGTAHRRFAMSLLLNDDYEGGSLRFPEYGPHTYRPPAGGAVVFSCSLLHEATDVTVGRRFVLLTFFYGEAERKLRDEYARKQGQVTPM